MLNFLLPLMKNPLAKLVVDRSINAINHSIEKKKIIRAKEIEAEQNVSLEQIKSSNSSIKDEVLTLKITLIFIALFIPYTQPWMEKGFEILKNAPQEFWWAVLIVYSGSFGLSTVSKIREKK